MSILARVREVADALTPAEQSLVRQIVSNPRDVALGTASELAQRIGVHEATASRLAKKLGYSSYSTFRAAIQEEFIIQADPAERVRNALQNGAESGILADLVRREIEALARLDRYVDDTAILQAATTLARARRVFVFARGNAQVLGALMDRRLRRMGRQPMLLGGDGRDLAEQLLDLGPDDVVLAFAFRRQPRAYAALLSHAHGVGAATICIAGTVGPSLQPQAGQLLFAPRAGTPDTFQTLSVPMAICNALVLGIAQVAPQAALQTLEKLGPLLAAFD